MTDDEYETVIRVAAALGVDQRDVEQRIVRYRTAAMTVRLEPGTKVVFTGDHPSAASRRNAGCQTPGEHLELR